MHTGRQVVMQEKIHIYSTVLYILITVVSQMSLRCKTHKNADLNMRVVAPIQTQTNKQTCIVG